MSNIVMYEDWNYQGRSLSVPRGWTKYSLVDDGFNDRMSSYEWVTP